MLSNRIVVVTGGSSGLGKAIALQAARKHATVVVLARNLKALRHVQAQASALSGHPAFAYAVDVSDPTSIDAMVQRLTTEVGTPDVLVNAAGFGRFQNALDTDFKVVQKMFATNVLGLMYLTQVIGRMMIDQHHGHIINVASMAGLMATPKSAVYAATKFAVVGFDNGLRLELKPFGVKVTTVNPGPINTNFFKVADATAYQRSVQAIALDPDRLAQRIVRAMGHAVREINAPRFMAIAAKGYTLMPHVGDWLAGGVFNRK
ncbi:SDR family NAD(P)-dependent oxidoreductase [Lacticaseibacillus manihotivorans]|jgi:short-subunit dehydrogenase|uniref:Short chain dehydrogenase family protein n=2 Tax=Lacticaseibacillus manihotivorans TaxID=88233 RepID=A0A0R1QGK8_9LACO|nr:SDR family oxidoreductase [Lacticaseibacillus manihotivorans]KRL43990.1 short chain dehydrogenase family protein [Lacticaseibacillus manihotivorans DSM 13343 = JCM 12514]QFQ91257.1 SDR family NAD(P)-dependent oxidoreductase [Lacticaseibacillus manihotivorans]